MNDTNPTTNDIRFDSKVGMAERQLTRIQREMGHVASRVRAKQFWSLLAVFAVVAALFALMLRGSARSGQIGEATAWTLIAVSIAIAVIASRVLASRIAGGVQETASKIEDAFPGLGERLLTASDLSQEQATGPLGQHLIGETHDHFRSHDWQNVVSTVSLWASRLCGAGALAGAIGVSMMDFSQEAEHSLSPTELILPQTKQDVTLLPGDVLIERGSSLVVTAEFSETAPDSAKLVTEYVDGTVAEILMKQNLSDPIIGGFVSRVDQPLKYKVVSDQWSSDLYSVDVFEFPELMRSDAALEFPDYTKMKSRTVEDTIKVSVVQGTEVTWRLLLNKPVESCALTREKGEPIVCLLESPVAKQSVAESLPEVAVYLTTIKAEKSETFTLQLKDDEGRENKYPPKLSIKVLPNKPPKLKLEKARDATVTALQELPLRASVQDDYGVSKSGISYTIEDEPEVSVKLAENLSRNVSSSVDYTLDFESLKAKPDDLVSYYFWAEDTGPNGEPRRTESDLFFADVRPFEEIFREGDSPSSSPSQGKPSGQSKNAFADLD